MRIPLRIAAFSAAVVVFTAGQEVLRVQFDRGTARQLFGWAAFSISTLIACLLAAVALGPARWGIHFFKPFLLGLQWETPALPRLPRRWAIPAFILAIAAFLLLVWHLLPLQTRIAGTDQAAYLDTAHAIHEAGGTGQLLRDLYTGRFAEANRHPLYLALLSVNPGERFGKQLSVVLASLAILLSVGLCARRFGSLAAAVCATLLVTNNGLLQSAVTIGCESLLVLAVSAAWGIAACAAPCELGLSTDTTRHSTDRHFALIPMIGVSVFLALAYLAKGTGLLFLMGFIGWIGWVGHMGRSGWLKPAAQVPPIAESGTSATAPPCRSPYRGNWYVAAACVLIAWGAVCSPLLVRNAIRYGSLTYNVNSWLLFQDQFVDPEPLAASSSLSAAAGDYVRTHSVGSMIARELRGLVWEIFMLFRTLGPVSVGNAGILGGALLLFAAGAGLRGFNRASRLLVAAWVIPHIVLLAWYVPIAAGDRFLAPLVPMLLTCAAVGIASAATRIPDRIRVPAVATGCLCWLSVVVVATLRRTAEF